MDAISSNGIWTSTDKLIIGPRSLLYSYLCRCDERPKPKAEEFTHLTYTGLLGGLEHLKIDEVNRREVCECDG
jgi:hypothetical protein